MTSQATAGASVVQDDVHSVAHRPVTWARRRSSSLSPTPDERDRIRAAMNRILQGTAQQSNGALTIVALAQEAGVPRNALTQRHLDLKNDFYMLVRARGQTPHSEIRLRQQIVRLKELCAKDATELAQLRTDVEHLVRVVNQLTAHSRQLLHALSQPDSPIRTLPTQPHPNRRR